MGSVFQEVFLSNIMIFLVMGFIMLLVTGWAFSLREVAGYILGWLLGVFLIIVLSTLLPAGEPMNEFDTLASQPVQLDFIALIIPSGFGLAMGFGLLTLIRGDGYNASRMRRALTIAIIVTIVLVAWYLLLLSGYQVRLLIAVFLLTFAIGGVTSFIMSRGFTFSRRTYVPPVAPDELEPINTLQMGHPVTPVEPSPMSPLGQRVRGLRDRMQRRAGYQSRDTLPNRDLDRDNEYQEIP